MLGAGMASLEYVGVAGIASYELLSMHLKPVTSWD